MKKAIQCLVCEFVGTFALCFVGILAIANTNGDLITAAWAHGLTIAVFASATMAISGAQFNPAVTIALVIARKMAIPLAICYIITQILAGIVASLLLLPIIGGINENLPVAQDAIALGTPQFDPGKFNVGSVILIEAVLTYFLMFVIYGTAVDKRAPKMSGLFIGLAVAIGVFAGGPLTGAAMNPARQMGPAMISGAGVTISQIWIYWVGPVIGAALASLTWVHCIEDQDEQGDPHKTAPVESMN